MFARKLEALDYHSPKFFDYKDEKTFRNFVSWIENQKIRLYKVEDRAALDNIDDPQWPQALQKYLEDLSLSPNSSDREAIIERLLSLAISYEFSDNIDKYDNTDENQSEFMGAGNVEEPFEKIDYTSNEFVDGLHRLQLLLNIPTKQNDNTTVLQAMSKLISDKFNSEAMQQAIEEAKKSKDVKETSVEFLLDIIDPGINTDDKVLKEAVKILRLLHIKELRDLQTKINETIVAVQTITANPKTDSSLGRVGK